MSTFRDWEAYKRLKNRADTNSVVDVLKNKSTGDLIVRKIIYGIEQPLYQAVFTREMRALYKLNKCSNIVNILGDDYLVISTTKEKVGVIYLEYINGIELGKSSIENFSAKERFLIIKQLLNVWENSVKSTHLFLTEKEIKNIKKYVPQALNEIEHLIVIEKENNNPIAFMGIENQKLEMLFVTNTERKKGIGKKLLNYGIQNYNINELTVNEQNLYAKVFYEHLGFKMYKRSEMDEQGNPYPILYMKLER